MRGINRNRNVRGQGRNFNSNRGHTVQPFGSNASQGPLMTNHLQLDELDLELALLKRKREMIEKQHTLLVNDSMFGGSSSQYGFNEASQGYGQRLEPTRNFSNMYNDPEPQYNRFNAQQGMKRPAIDPWDNSSPKRFNASSGYKKPARYESARYESRPSRSQPASHPPPLMSSSYRPRRPPPPATRSNLKSGRVTKPRQNTAPNNLNSLPVEERSKLVTKASSLVQKTSELIYYEADKPPNSKLQGRLALALGSVVREMRDEYGAVDPHVETFTNMSCLRALKHSIRERIRDITVGTKVGSAVDVLGLYRKKHPKDTDIELLYDARKHMVQNGNLAIEIIKQGHPEKYFRVNFRRLLDASLTEMFEKMQLLYANVRDGRSIQEVIDGLLVELDKPLQEAIIDQGNAEGTQAAENAETGESGDKLDESGAEVDVTPNKSEETAEQSEENAKAEGNDVKRDETVEEPKENGDKPAEENNATRKKPRPHTSREEIVRAKFYSKLMDTLMRRHLPSILPKYKEFILKILNTNEAFKETKAYLIQTTNEKVERENGESTPASAASKKTYFVKIAGRPQLPKKKLMKAFLDTFNPTLIKKHRTMHNILFVSFDKEENFNNILAKNGESIGNYRLDIRVSERVNKKENEENKNEQNKKTNEKDVAVAEPKSEDNNIQIDQNLDNQINDLLTSIREEEEHIDHAEGQNEEETLNEGEEFDENAEIDEGAQAEQESANNENTEDDGNAVEEDQQQEEEKPAPNETDNKEPDTKNTTPDKNTAPVKNAVPAKNEPAAKGTPTRASARKPVGTPNTAGTPSAVRTRRASKLGN